MLVLSEDDLSTDMLLLSSSWWKDITSRESWQSVKPKQ
jgi:hypothetical protein